MTERPLLMSAPMVRAVLAGTKTQTRRLVKPQPIGGDTIIQNGNTFQCGQLRDSENAWREIMCPHGTPGDWLWVREGFACSTDYEITYRASVDESRYPADFRWRPSIHMPRWASRLTLEITAVRVERPQDITEADARAEGVSYHEASHVWGDGLCFPTAVEAFGELWGSINGKRAPWASNPFVWVIGFKRLELYGPMDKAIRQLGRPGRRYEG